MTARLGIALRRGRVAAVLRDGSVQELRVLVDGREERAVAYPALSGRAAEGEEVLLNVTAVGLGLGTGGVHFVVARLGAEHAAPAEGHLMKLRYTPLQFAYGGPEDGMDPGHAELAAAEGAQGLVAVCLELHSQIAPAAAAIRVRQPAARIAYLMTDGGALPMAFSDTVAALREKGLIDVAVTCGNAFGGDVEAVNLHSGLLIARRLLGADFALVAIGPGLLGSATPFGHTGVQQGEAVNAAAAVGAQAVAALRLSFCDERGRHRGISHHTATALGRVALAPAAVAVPELGPDEAAAIARQLEFPGSARHRFLAADGRPGMEFLASLGLAVQSMGRDFADDPAFFLAAAAAGDLAARMQSGAREEAAR